MEVKDSNFFGLAVKHAFIITSKRPRLQTIQSLRFTFFERAAQLVRPRRAFRLRLMDHLDTRRGYERVARALARAA